MINADRYWRSQGERASEGMSERRNEKAQEEAGGRRQEHIPLGILVQKLRDTIKELDKGWAGAVGFQDSTRFDGILIGLLALLLVTERRSRPIKMPTSVREAVATVEPLLLEQHSEATYRTIVWIEDQLHEREQLARSIAVGTICGRGARDEH